MTDKAQEPDDLILPPGMLAKYDQLQSEWGKMAESVGYFYYELRRWGINESYAIQLAARFQDQIVLLLEQSIRRDSVKKLTDELLATPKPPKNAE